MAKARVRLRPDSPFRRGWDVLTVLLSVIFLRHSLLPLEERSVLVVYFEMLWFLLDIYVTSKTSMILRDGGVVSDGDRVLRIYKSKWLWADVFFALPWEPIWAIIMRPPVQPKHGNRIIRNVGKGLGWVARRVVRAKNAIGDRIPRPLRPKAIRRFLRLTDTLDVKKMDGVKHLVKHKGWIRKTVKVLRVVARYVRLCVGSFLHRVWGKTRVHLPRRWSPWADDVRYDVNSKPPARTRREADDRTDSVSSYSSSSSSSSSSDLGGFRRWLNSNGRSGRGSSKAGQGLASRRRQGSATATALSSAPLLQRSSRAASSSPSPLQQNNNHTPLPTPSPSPPSDVLRMGPSPLSASSTASLSSPEPPLTTHPHLGGLLAEDHGPTPTSDESENGPIRLRKSDGKSDGGEVSPRPLPLPM